MKGVIGIDADRMRLAVVAHRNGVKTWYTLDRMDAQGAIRAEYLRALPALLAGAAKRDVVFLEGIWLPAKPKARDVDVFRVLANVQGEIVYEAARQGCDVRLVPPVDWQRRVLGVAADRERIKSASAQEARRFLESWNLSEHESDAACICLYGIWALKNEAAKQ